MHRALIGMRAVLLVALVGGCVMMRAPMVAERPRWRITGGDELVAGCATARVMIRKSGKQGIGLALQLRARQPACSFATTRIALAFRGGGVITFAPPQPLEIAAATPVYAWLPLAFDNNAAWNDERVDAVLALDYRSGDAAGTWSIGMHQR